MSDTQPDVHDNVQEPTNEAEQPQADQIVPPVPEAEVVSETDSAASAAQNGSNGSTGVEMQLADAQAKAAEYLDGWQRARADFANYKKRAEKEREEAYQVAAADTLRKLLPVIDDFDRAISNVPTEKADDDVIKGFSLIHRKMVSLLENSGIKVINPVGETFNPAQHEAIGQDDSSDVASGHITVVLQKGYLHGDRVLRPALVRVAS
jgi:molecular chaperone GrpE